MVKNKKTERRKKQWREREKRSCAVHRLKRLDKVNSNAQHVARSDAYVRCNNRVRCILVLFPSRTTFLNTFIQSISFFPDFFFYFICDFFSIFSMKKERSSLNQLFISFFVTKLYVQIDRFFLMKYIVLLTVVNDPNH